MFSTSGDSFTGSSGGLRHFSGIDGADGETFEIRYVDDAEAAMWATERGYLLGPDDITTGLLAYPE
jgi:hypothetical protein